MTHLFNVGDARDGSLERLARRLLVEWAEMNASRLPDGPRLVLFHPAAPVPDFGFERNEARNVALKMARSETESNLLGDEVKVARADSASLPLQTASLGAVLLVHLVARGEEEELGEACRIVQPGGFVLILGLNRMGLKHLADRSKRGLPAISPLSVRDRLEELEMNVVATLAAGFLRGDRPRQLNRGLARMLIPVADLLLIVARPMEPKIMNPLSEARKVRTVGAPSALAGH